jgi:chorismate lyase/3-hydroxybenzoate synthase
MEWAVPEKGKTLLRLHHMPGCTLDRPSPESAWLGGVCFGGWSHDPEADSPPLVQVQLTPLKHDGSPGQACCEAWAVSGPVRQGQQDELSWRCNDTWWFGAVQIDEVAMQNLPEAGTPLQRATRRAYSLLFEAMSQQGFANLVRAWNYVADINGTDNGLERYRQFNIARQEVFLTHGRSVEGGSVPAASALGAKAHAPFVLYALASCQPVKAIENPRQVSAYCYPKDYGPRSPTFSRAALAQVGSRQPLFISGTASIVGHRSMHHGDVIEQTRETLRNLQVVLDQAGTETTGLAPSTLTYKVYVRHAEDWPQVHAELCRAVGGEPQVLALQADVCRDDLLVEIEAVGFGLPVAVPVTACSSAS